MTLSMGKTLPPGIIEYAAKHFPELKKGTDNYWKILRQKYQNHSIWHEYTDTLLPETKQLLDDFYRPYNIQLAKLLQDDKFLFLR